ncbi:MAG: NUDIX hydrolase [Pseudomonadota bacterium]|nr:NUDIX hydrolase [Pseudomonadota bacterium]
MAFACEFPYATVGTGLLPVIPQKQGLLGTILTFLRLKKKKAGRIMLVKRADTMALHGGLWGVPGGYWRVGGEPSPADALFRENKEELGEAFAKKAAQLKMKDVTHVRINQEPNSLFGLHDDAAEFQTNMHHLWRVWVNEKTCRLADVSFDREEENTAVGFFTIEEILAEPDKFAPWLPETLTLFQEEGHI